MLKQKPYQYINFILNKKNGIVKIGTWTVSEKWNIWCKRAIGNVFD